MWISSSRWDGEGIKRRWRKQKRYAVDVLSGENVVIMPSPVIQPESGAGSPKRKGAKVKQLRIPPECFVCGKDMVKPPLSWWWCFECEVSVRYDLDYYNRTRYEKYTIFYGMVIDYIDHSQVSMPSPA
jgi:hypothetical protein